MLYKYITLWKKAFFGKQEISKETKIRVVLRRIDGITRKDKIKNDGVWRKLRVESIL